MAGVEPTSAGLEPAVRSAGLHPFEDGCSVGSRPRERKRAAPFRKRLLNETRPVKVLVIALRAPPGGRFGPCRRIALSMPGPRRARARSRGSLSLLRAGSAGISSRRRTAQSQWYTNETPEGTIFTICCTAIWIKGLWRVQRFFGYEKEGERRDRARVRRVSPMDPPGGVVIPPPRTRRVTLSLRRTPHRWRRWRRRRRAPRASWQESGAFSFG